MTGAQFDSAAQAQLQQHDKYKSFDDQGREIASPTVPAISSATGSRKDQASSGAASSPTHYVFNANSSPKAQPASAASSSSNINVSLQLLDKYGQNGNVEGQSQSSPKTSPHHASSVGVEDPKSHDRRL